MFHLQNEWEEGDVAKSIDKTQLWVGVHLPHLLEEVIKYSKHQHYILAVHLLSGHVARVSMWRCLGPCKGNIICVETPVHVGLVADRPKRSEN